MVYLRLVKVFLLLGLAGFVALMVYGYGRNHPEDLPWPALDLARPVGAFTGRKLAALGGHKKQCQALLGRAGIRFRALPPRSDGERCGYRDAVRVTGGSADVAFRPAGLVTSCPVAAALALWEWHVVQAAALDRLGSEVVAIDHFGSYSCRRLYGRSEGAWSEHASANAVDIAGFRLADGTRVTVRKDWRGSGRKAAFLHAVRDGACGLFATVLSPDYNAAHIDHFHLDEAARGAIGGRACR